MRRVDIALLLAVLVFAFGIRLLTLPTIDAGGDALLKWYQGKIALGLVPGEWEWSHHTARLGIMGPIVAVQALFGTHPFLYYAPALTTFLIQIALVLYLGIRLHGRILGAGVALFVAVFPQMQISGVQLLPGIFSGTYILAALVCLVGYRDAVTKARVALGLCAVAMFAAYLTKLSNLFFFPGLLTAAWLWRKNTRDVLFLAALTTGLILAETVLYSVLTSHPLGRFGMVQAAHAPMGPIDSPFDLFSRYADLPWSWLTLLTAYSLAATGVLAGALAGRLDERTAGVVLVPATFLLGLTFSVRSFDPLIPAQAFNARYLTAALPLLAMGVGLSVAHLASGWLPARTTARVSPAGAAAALLAVLVLAGGWHCAVHFPGRAAHPLTSLAAYSESVADFEQGTPLVSVDPRGLGIRTWLMLFWDEPQPPVHFLEHPAGALWIAFAPGQEWRVARLEQSDVLLADAQRLPGSDSYSFKLSRIPFTPPSELP